MPTYKVTDPATGKTLRLSGDSPPTEQELTQIFGSVSSTAKKPGQGNLTPEQRASLEANILSDDQRNATEPNRMTKVLAGVQKALGKSGAASAALPVAGGVIGGVLGGATGTGHVGAIGGAAGGAGIAERLQQLLDPSKALGQGGAADKAMQEGNVLKAIAGDKEDMAKVGEAAATSAAFDVATLGLGKVLSPVGKGISKAFSLPERAKVFQEAFTVNRQMAKKIGLPEASKKLTEYGLAGSLDDLGKVAGEVTGQNGALSTGVRKVLGGLDSVPVTTSGALDSASEALEAATLVENDLKKKTTQQIAKILNKSQSGILETKPLEAFDAIKELELQEQVFNRAAYDANGIVKDVKSLQLAKAYGNAAKTLENQIDDLPTDITKDIVASIKTPETIARLRAVSPKLAKEFEEATTIRQLRSLQRPFVSLSKAVEETLAGSSSVFAKTGRELQKGGFRAIPGIGAVAGLVADVANSAPVRTGLASAPERFAQRASPDALFESLRPLVSGTRPAGEVAKRETVLQAIRSQLGQ